MKRLATTVAIAAWTGFLGVFSAELLLHALAPDVLEAASRVAWAPAVAAQIDGIGEVLAALSPPAAAALALACLAMAGLLLRALMLLHAKGPSSPAAAERFAGAALAGLAALALATELTPLALLPIDPGSGLVWLAIALTIAALLFDRLIAFDVPDDDAEFHAAIGVIAEGMARQTRLYANRRPNQGDQRP